MWPVGKCSWVGPLFSPPCFLIALFTGLCLLSSSLPPSPSPPHPHVVSPSIIIPAPPILPLFFEFWCFLELTSIFYRHTSELDWKCQNTNVILYVCVYNVCCHRHSVKRLIFLPKPFPHFIHGWFQPLCNPDKISQFSLYLSMLHFLGALPLFFISVVEGDPQITCKQK